MFQYEIYVLLLDQYSIPKSFLDNKYIPLKEMVKEEVYQKLYCSCVSFYYCNKEFNDATLIYLDRAFINKDFDIAFEGTHKYFTFDTKENILPKLKQIVLTIINRIYNLQTFFPT